MIIGLISEPKSYTRKLLINRLFGIKVTDSIITPQNPFEVYAEILPFSNEVLENMSPARLYKLLNKKIQKFEKSGIKNFILSDCLYKLCQTKGIDTIAFSNGCGKNLFLMITPLCIRQTAKKYNINLLHSSVCICNTKMDRISEYLMRELCFDTKKLILCTKNVNTAKTFCESFYDETGLWVEVATTLNSTADIVIDINNCEVKIGRDLFIRDAGFHFNFCEYKVSQCDIAALLPSPNLSHIQWFYSYDKLK